MAMETIKQALGNGKNRSTSAEKFSFLQDKKNRIIHPSEID